MASSSCSLGILVLLMVIGTGEALWCVVRSSVSQQQLQTALDYACGAGADCAPIQSNGLCYLPNTLESHAAYAFNSYYQRRNNAPGSCDFAGSATIATTNPSYGSCTYPDSPSSAGGIPNTPGTPGTNGTMPGTPGTFVPTPPGTFVPTPPGAFAPPFPVTPSPGLGPDGSQAAVQYSASMIFFASLIVSYFLLLF
ncbi:hypothetical protein ACHQM5_028137 [Ranunculus cassubicifolius]